MHVNRLAATSACSCVLQENSLSDAHTPIASISCGFVVQLAVQV